MAYVDAEVTEMLEAFDASLVKLQTSLSSALTRVSASGDPAFAARSSALGIAGLRPETENVTFTSGTGKSTYDTALSYLATNLLAAISELDDIAALRDDITPP